MSLTDAQKRSVKAQKTRKSNQAEREKLLTANAKVSSELKAIKKLIKDGWSPPIQ